MSGNDCQCRHLLARPTLEHGDGEGVVHRSARAGAVLCPAGEASLCRAHRNRNETLLGLAYSLLRTVQNDRDYIRPVSTGAHDLREKSRIEATHGAVRVSRGKDHPLKAQIGKAAL